VTVASWNRASGGLDLRPAPGAAPGWQRLVVQAGHELRVTLRNGEQLLLTVVIPTVLLVLFTTAPVLDLPTPRVGFLVPGILALAVMSTAFTGQAISVGFERRYAVLRRLSTTPLTRGVLLAAKTLSVLATELLQVALLCLVGLALGWSPAGGDGAALTALGLVVVGTAAFSAMGLLMAGTLRAEATLAGANLVYLVLLVLGGVAFPLSDFGPTGRAVLQLLPISALSGGLRAALYAGQSVPFHDWVTLVVWAACAAVLAGRFFRWE
jgi:ABC-2 type transport system permease protein